MTLVQVYALRCDGCNAASSFPHDFRATSAEARAIAARNGWERLHNPINVRRGYVDPNRLIDQRRRLDYCPRCAPAVRQELAEIQPLV